MPVEFSEENEITVVTISIPRGMAPQVINVVEPGTPEVITLGVPGMQGIPGPAGPQGVPGPPGGITDHGALSGLGDDDHPHYHNNARGDARYALLSHSHPISQITATGTRDDTTYLRGDGTWATPAGGGGGGGVSDHGSLTGLTDDDHTQYYNQTRGDARYTQIGHTHTSANISDATELATGSTVVRRHAGGWAAFTSVSISAAPVSDNEATRKDYVDTQIGTRAPTSHTHPASAISDSTATGRSVLTAVDAATARTAIGAVTIGTTSSTAKAGNYQPTAANISDSTAVGRSLITAVDAATARSAIGAGTSNLNIGTTSTTAAAGDHTHTGGGDLEAVMDHLGTGGLTAGSNISLSYNDLAGTITVTGANPGIQTVSLADMPSGYTHTVYKHPINGWPARPTSRVDVHIIWKGADPSPAIVSSGTGGMHDNTNGYGDSRFVTT